MARIRSIHPGLFTDEAFMVLTTTNPIAIPLLMGIWTEADDHGVFEVKPLTLKARILPAAMVEVGSLLAELERLDFLRQAVVDGKEYGFIRNFCRYQRPKKPKFTHPLPHEFRPYVASDASGSEPDSDEGPIGSEPDRPSNPPSSPPVGNRFGTGGEKSPQREEGGGREEVSSLRSDMSDRLSEPPPVAVVEGRPEAAQAPARTRRQRRDDEPEGFAAFYAAYPRREARIDAAKAFPAAVTAAGGLDALMTGLRRFRFGDDPQYHPLPASWLRKRRWQDEPAPRGPVPTPPPADLDLRYFDRPAGEVQALPKPRIGTPEFRAWQHAGQGFTTPVPGSQFRAVA